MKRLFLALALCSFSYPQEPSTCEQPEKIVKTDSKKDAIILCSIILATAILQIILDPQNIPKIKDDVCAALRGTFVKGITKLARQEAHEPTGMLFEHHVEF